MTPEQKIKHKIIITAYEYSSEKTPEINIDNIDDVYDDLVEDDNHWDAKSEIREGEIETNISCEYSRHLESKSVAMLAPSGEWVGWTYWFGGGEQAEPEAVDWMSKAYDLECKEREEVVFLRDFTKL